MKMSSPSLHTSGVCVHAACPVPPATSQASVVHGLPSSQSESALQQPKMAVVSQVPVTEVREMDSVVSAHSGEVVIMGGLMQEVSSNNTSGVPGFQDVPWVGNLFKSNDDDREVTELVIFLKATIVPAPVPVGTSATVMRVSDPLRAELMTV